MVRIDVGQKYILEVVVNSHFREGLTINYYIQKSDTDELISSGQMAEVGNGLYKTEITLSEEGQYRVFVEPPYGYERAVETILVQNREKDMYDRITTILGLVTENYRLFDIQYTEINGRQYMTYAKVKIYANAQDLVNDVNPIRQFEVISEYDNNGNLTSFIKKEL